MAYMDMSFIHKTSPSFLPSESFLQPVFDSYFTEQCDSKSLNLLSDSAIFCSCIWNFTVL